jgi:lipoprotein-anchoring transpeptidase ErfK/SrfK
LTPVLAPRPAHPRLAAAALAILAVVAGVACTGSRPELADEPATTTSVGEPTTTTTTQAAPLAEVAQARGDAIDLFADSTSTTPSRQITAPEATSAPNIPIVFLIKSKDDDRLEVYLPVAPAGSTGWVDKADVTVSSVTFRIEVSLAEHRVRVFDRDQVVLDEPAAIGTTDRPSPGVVTYIKELLQPPDATGPYGAYAYGLSGFATDLASFNDGQGVIGIHGTNDPSTVGHDVDRGCIGLTNEAITRLVDEIGLPLGTPVEIVA